MVHLDDTIAAIATPLGTGGIGVVRLSGPRAVSIAAALFQPARSVTLDEVPSHTLHYGRLVFEGRTLDEVLVAVMRQPHSFTREDVVELQTHGSPVALRSVLEAVVASGARHAEPGEFTRRAFTNGRLSLDQAQAVLDVIQAKTPLGARSALERLEGKFSRTVARLRDELTGLLAAIGVGMDYPEYEQDALPRSTLSAQLERALDALEDVLRHSHDGRLVRRGFRLAIVGRPNVGKSTLLNALLATDRALVSPEAGTTRDTLEEVLSLEGVPFCLVDTAGLHAGGDALERLGMERTHATLREADLALVVLDASAPENDEDAALLAELADQPRLVLLNKVDRVRVERAKLNHETLAISARTGQGLDALKQRLVSWAWGGHSPRGEGLLFLDVREKDMLLRAQSALERALRAQAQGNTLDLVAAEVQQALEALGELSGQDASEAVIERIFAQFCVGK